MQYLVAFFNMSVCLSANNIILISSVVDAVVKLKDKKQFNSPISMLVVSSGFSRQGDTRLNKNLILYLKKSF